MAETKNENKETIIGYGYSNNTILDNQIIPKNLIDELNLLPLSINFFLKNQGLDDPKFPHLNENEKWFYFIFKFIFIFIFFLICY